jgi:sugar lactone lactonase YvrE
MPDASAGQWSIALELRSELTERPVWDERERCLVWVDIPAGDAHRLRPDGTDRSVKVGAPLGAAGLREHGGLICASAGRLVFLDSSNRQDREPIDAGLATNVRFNDGACDPAGRFLVGTTSLDGRREQGHLLSVSADGRIEVLLDRITESNGLCWSLDGNTLYYVDSGEPYVRAHAYDPRTGQLGPGTELIEIAEADGEPDGLSIDADGAIWVALWRGSAVRRYGPDGRLLAHLPMPASRPTCPGFGGDRLDRLYVTTAWEGMTPDERAGEPWAGHILVTSPGVSGCLAHRFAG